MKNVIIKFKKESDSANGIEEINQLKNTAMHECKKIAKTQLDQINEKYKSIKKTQEEKCDRRIEEEKRWLSQQIESTSAAQQQESGRIEDNRQEAMLEIARICDQRYKELKGGNNE